MVKAPAKITSSSFLYVFFSESETEMTIFTQRNSNICQYRVGVGKSDNARGKKKAESFIQNVHEYVSIFDIFQKIQLVILKLISSCVMGKKN